MSESLSSPNHVHPIHAVPVARRGRPVLRPGPLVIPRPVCSTTFVTQLKHAPNPQAIGFPATASKACSCRDRCPRQPSSWLGTATIHMNPLSALLQSPFEQLRHITVMPRTAVIRCNLQVEPRQRELFNAGKILFRTYPVEQRNSLRLSQNLPFRTPVSLESQSFPATPRNGVCPIPPATQMRCWQSAPRSHSKRPPNADLFTLRPLTHQRCHLADTYEAKFDSRYLPTGIPTNIKDANGRPSSGSDPLSGRIMKN